MSPAARAAEITSILAAAIVRSQLPQLKTNGSEQREVNLGFLPDQRVHTNPYQTENL
jgi:hypothetical protein